MMQASASEGVTMVQLEMMGLAATDATLVEVGAAMLIALEDGAADARRDVSPALARRRMSARRGFGFRVGRCADGFGVGFAAIHTFARRFLVDLRLGTIALLLESLDEQPHRLQVQVA